MRAALHTLRHIVAAVVFASAAAPAAAQVALPVASQNPALAPGVRLDGLFYSAPVTIDGATIFRIARSATDASAEPIEVRSQFIQAALGQVLATKPDGSTLFNPKTLAVQTRKEGAQEYLVATDGSGQPDVPLLTITAADAERAHSTVALVASDWQHALQAALEAALIRRQPSELKRNYNLVAAAAVALLLLTAAMWSVLVVLRRRMARHQARADERQEQLDREGAQASAAAAAGASEQRRRFLALALRASAPAERASRVRAIAWIVRLTIVIVWVSAIEWALSLFPQTAAIGAASLTILGSVVAVWLGAAILTRIADLLIGHIARADGRTSGSSEERARSLLRAPTIVRALGGFKNFLIFFIAALWTFSIIGIPVTSVVTIGGVLALAISFAAQNLVRDLLNGLLVLLEDQYVVGDYVMIGDYNGIVEAFTLRMVQIRDARGNLITIPHSSAIQTVNASRNWSRVDYRVAIDPAANLADAIAALRASMERLASEASYRGNVVEAVETIGVEMISKNGIVLRASMRTVPLRQFQLYRALNQEVLAEFAARGIALGIDPLPPLPLAPHASPDPT